MTPEKTADWELFKKMFITPAYNDGNKQKFTNLRQGKMTRIK